MRKKDKLGSDLSSLLLRVTIQNFLESQCRSWLETTSECKKWLPALFAKHSKQIIACSLLYVISKSALFSRMITNNYFILQSALVFFSYSSVALAVCAQYHNFTFKG